MKKCFSLLLALWMALGLAACSSSSAIRYDIPSPISNLDPQFATDDAARMVISQVFEGLFRQLPSGEVEPALAESYILSEDGLTYTFRLRQDAQWSGNGVRVSSGGWEEGTPVTAHDFVFALRRMFDPAARSPFAAEFSRIQNAQRILDGEVDYQSLGVQALDDYTLQIRLDRPDNLLPQRLAASYAMPCNEEFFLSTKGRYGLDADMLLYNGPFYIRKWSHDEYVSMRRNPEYVSEKETIAGGIAFYIQEDGLDLDRLLDGEIDAMPVTADELDTVAEQGLSYDSFEDTVWVLLLNNQWNLGTEEEPLYPFGEGDIRRAISHTVDRSLFSGQLAANLRPASTLVPSAIFFLGWPYRTLAGEESPIVTSSELAKRYQVTGLENLGLERLPTLTLLVPDTGNLPQVAGYLQQGITQSLSVYCGLEVVPQEELDSRVASGRFQLAVYPLTADYASPEAFLGAFTSGSGANFQGYADPTFDALLEEASGLSGRELLATYQQAEERLLSEGGAIPLFFETSYYAAAQGVSGLQFSPFLSGFSFRDAVKN